MTATTVTRPRVLIVGCGFGGLEAAKAFRRADVDVTVVDRTNHHLFQPLLYQVASAALTAPAIAAPVRHILRKQANVTTLLGEVKTIDVAARQALLEDGAALPYDHLIVAAGAVTSYFGRDEWAQHAPGLKTLQDAFEIRRRVLMAFEHAEREADPDARAAWLTFVVIGGGPTGVEMAGTLAEIAKRTLPGEFRHIRPEEARVLLVEGGDRVLGMMPAKLGESAGAQLRALGVELQLNSRVTAIDATGVAISVAGESEPRRIATQCVIWGAGVAGAPLGAKLAQAAGIALARGGRVPVEPDLSVAGHPEISVIGDLAQAMSHAPGTEPQPVPGVSPAAKQMGRAAATNILRRIRAEATQPFRYRDYGTLATIGRNSAVVDLASPLGPIRFSGKLAWLFWLFAHIYFLIDFRAKAVVLFDWATAYWTEQRYARVVAEATRD